MRTRTLAAGVAVALVVTTGAAALASDGKGRSGKSTDVTLYATETSSTYITATGQVDPPEAALPAPGDRFVSVDTLYADVARTETVGRNDISCTFTEVSGTTEADVRLSLLCDGVVTLDGQGSLAWQGAALLGAEVDPSSPFITVALTGGTGAFTRAGGEVDVFDESTTETESLTRYELDLRLLKATTR